MNSSQIRSGPIGWMARNRVAANLLMFALMIGGVVMSARMMRKEVFPRVELDMVSVVVPYPGASPAEVEQGIILAIEEAIRPLDGIKEIRSTASESAGSVSIELEVGVDKNKALTDVKNAIDRITSFPEETERPIVNAPEWRVEAISLAIYGEQEEKVLHALGERIRDEILALSEVSYVELGGTRPLEISIEITQETLRKYNLTLPLVAGKIRRTALELPAGAIKARSGDILLRTTERRDFGSQFGNIPIISNQDGSAVLLADIAEIKDTYAEVDFKASFEGQPAVYIDVFSVGNQSPTDVAVAVKDYVANLGKQLPQGAAVKVWHDHSKLYAQRLDLLLRNAAIGLVLVLLILGLFLEPKLAFWVTWGIPVSFLGSLVLLPAMGVSLNMVSLFAFIVTLGMVVDDAIVVGENTFRLRQEGVPLLKAAIQGAKEVSTPVFFSIATTVVAFSPLLFIPGTRGKFMYHIPVVVILVLVLSLVESFFILPAHLSHKTFFLEYLGKIFRVPFIINGQRRFSLAVEKFVKKIYAPFLEKVVKYRWITLATAIAAFIGVQGLIAGGRIKHIDFPREESDMVIVEARLPFGSAIEETQGVMEHLIESAQSVIEKNGGQKTSLGVSSMLGVSYLRRAHGSHVTSVAVTLVESDQRPFGSAEFADMWRAEIGEIAGLETLLFNSSTGRRTKPIDLELSHPDTPTLEAAAQDLARDLGGFKGVKDIEDGIERGKNQMDFKLTKAGNASGITVADLASQVRSAFYGAEVLRQQRGRNEVKVMVRYPRSQRESLHNLEEMLIKTPLGGDMPLRQAATIIPGRAYVAINRTDGKRTVRIRADVDGKKANPQEVMQELFKEKVPDLKKKYRGLQFNLAGRQKDMQDFNDYLFVGFMMALIVMYGLIAIPLKSYLQPGLVVMAAIPFGYIGAVLGHLFMGYDISLVSLMGIVALAGVVVNDSIVFVAAANNFRAQGWSPIQAALAAAQQRFRPIVLTSLTTFGGLSPMIVETSVQARILIPMAISLGFGVLFSTFVILLLVPCLFVMIENLRRLSRGWSKSLTPPETTFEEST
jgi:multidrug efflux pump subunit AcrB